MHQPQPVSLDDFYAHMPDHRYIFAPTRDLWPASSVNSRLEWPKDQDGKPKKPTDILDTERSVEQMAWIPGEPMVLKDRLIDGGGVIHRQGCRSVQPLPTADDRTRRSRWGRAVA